MDRARRGGRVVSGLAINIVRIHGLISHHPSRCELSVDRPASQTQAMKAMTTVAAPVAPNTRFREEAIF
jgi:hypothetical protein